MYYLKSQPAIQLIMLASQLSTSREGLSPGTTDPQILPCLQITLRLYCNCILISELLPAKVTQLQSSIFFLHLTCRQNDFHIISWSNVTCSLRFQHLHQPPFQHGLQRSVACVGIISRFVSCCHHTKRTSTYKQQLLKVFKINNGSQLTFSQKNKVM